MNFENITQAEIVNLLKLEDFSKYYREANDLTLKIFKNQVYIRAILEFSNHCSRECKYCGLNCFNDKLSRYRMNICDIVDTCIEAFKVGYKTIVLQSGEDKFYKIQDIGYIIREVKKYDIAITLSIGELTRDELKYLKECGADRYLLKHETSDKINYKFLHPYSSLETRIECLKNIKDLGYMTGGGFMIGLPNQSFETIADDLLLTKELKCDMAGIGPFISHPNTALKDYPNGSTELTKRVVAIARLMMPNIWLPATTSLGVLDNHEKEQVFSCGANVIMNKVTPTNYRKLYEIYPSENIDTNIKDERIKIENLIKNIGKIPV